MPQFYCQQSSRPDPWLLGRTSAGLCTLQTACPLTVTYSGGTPAADTIAAGSAATVYGGSAATFDASADVWVVLTVPASGTLQVVREADLATVTGDWAGLARIVQHSTEPYQPQASLAAGGAGAPGGTSVAIVSDLTAVAKSLWNGSSNDAPPASWETVAYDDSAWTAAVVSNTNTGFWHDISGASYIWPQHTPLATTERALLRQHIALPAGTITAATLEVLDDNIVVAAYLNGTALPTLVGYDTETSGSLDPFTLSVVPGLLHAAAANVLAIEVANADPGGPPQTAGVGFALHVSYAGAGQLVAVAGPQEGDLLFYHSGAWTRLPISAAGDVLTSDGTDPAWAADTGGSGTVTSVAIAGPTGTTASGSPVTSSGTLTLSWSSQSAGTFLGAPGGSSGVPTFRVLAAGDIPSLPASQIGSGQLAPARGGTGLDGAAAANGTLLIGNGSGYTLAALTAGSGVTITGGSGTITIASSGGGSGTVTSVALTLPAIFSVAGSPVTTSGTLAVTLATENAATVFAGPASGSAAAPTFRALEGTDLPAAAAAGGHIHAHGHFL